MRAQVPHKTCGKLPRKKKLRRCRNRAQEKKPELILTLMHRSILGQVSSCCSSILTLPDPRNHPPPCLMLSILLQKQCTSGGALLVVYGARMAHRGQPYVPGWNHHCACAKKLAGAQWGMTIPGVGNEPFGDSLQGNHRGLSSGSFPSSLPAYRT